jgi:hypothetical protein
MIRGAGQNILAFPARGCFNTPQLEEWGGRPYFVAIISPWVAKKGKDTQ